MDKPIFAMLDAVATIVLLLVIIALLQGNNGNSLAYIVLVQASGIWLIMGAAWRYLEREKG